MAALRGRGFFLYLLVGFERLHWDSRLCCFLGSRRGRSGSHILDAPDELLDFGRSPAIPEGCDDSRSDE